MIETQTNIIVNKKPSGITFCILDCPAKYNSLGSPVMYEITQLLEAFKNDRDTKALVFLSGKKDSFVIGADLAEIRKAPDAETLQKLSQAGHRLLDVIENYPKPVVVGIHGTCLGGGLEIALACHKRIATNDEKTILGLPETRIGIIPGLGGTQRLPKIVGLKNALPIILSAEPISVKQAKEIGLVDEIVEADDLLDSLEKAALVLVDNPNGSAKSSNELSPEQRDKLLALTERSIRIKTRGNYPAQTKVIEVIKHGYKNGIAAGLVRESEVFGELACSEIANNLMALFFSTDFAQQSLANYVTKFSEGKVENIGIVGAGAMGLSIAGVLAVHGYKVQIKTRSEKVNAAVEKVKSNVQRRLQHKEDINTASILNNITGITDNSQLSQCDLIIETIVEDIAIKAKILKEISEATGPNCVITSNTSSFSVEDLAKHVDNNERFLGLHFFHPVEKMPLVEIISHNNTNKAAIGAAASLITKLGKTAVLVKDRPGFLINRILARYLLETAHLTEENIPLNWIEQAAIEFGMPIGPLELVDEVGIDVVLKVAHCLNETLGTEMPAIIGKVEKLGIMGKKTGNGLYLWDENGKRGNFNPALFNELNLSISPEKASKEVVDKIAARLIIPMIDEAAHCLLEKVVAKPREIDMALILGVGFPPFRGGLLKYADKIGIKEINSQLRSFYDNGTDNKTICPLLQKYEDENRSFYALGSNN